MNLSLILSQHAHNTPDRPALITRQGTTTYLQLEQMSDSMAVQLRKLGVQQSTRVLVLIPIGPELYATLAALWKLGAVAVIVDPGAGTANFRHGAKATQPEVFVGIPKAHLLRLLSPELRQVRKHLVTSGWLPFTTPWIQQKVDAVAALDLPADAPALITFTSGSTARPKAASRSHAFLLAQNQALQHTLQLEPDGTHLCTLAVVTLTVLAAGGTALIPDAKLARPGFIDPEPVLKQLNSHPALTVAASPAFVERLAENGMLPFKRIYVGGAPVFPYQLELFTKQSQAEVYSVYGSTEAEPIAEQAYAEIKEADFAQMRTGKGLLAGLPVEEIQLKILPDQHGQLFPYQTRQAFEAAALPSLRTGEIVVTGGHVLKSYLDPAGNKETKWMDETGTTWHRTGDAGYLDQQGRLWLLGRCSAKVQDSKGTLYPFSVEVAAQHHTAVKRAALTAQDGKRVLWVQWKDPEDLSGLKKMLEWASLDDIRSIAKIPLDRRHNAKVDYTRLNHK
ncbi:AMP-binding protein [Deinococcus roseus]|nr:AMP-binding protein [Deinococcus roseus]